MPNVSAKAAQKSAHAACAHEQVQVAAFCGQLVLMYGKQRLIRTDESRRKKYKRKCQDKKWQVHLQPKGNLVRQETRGIIDRWYISVHLELKPCITWALDSLNHGHGLDCQLRYVGSLEAGYYSAACILSIASVNRFTMIVVITGKNDSWLNSVQHIVRYVYVNKVLVRSFQITALKNVTAWHACALRFTTHAMDSRSRGNIAQMLIGTPLERNMRE